MKPTRSWLFSRNSTVRDRHNDVRLDEIVAMPEQVPLLLIGRLAVDAQYRGQGIGLALLADALRRCLAAFEIAGARAVIAHAIDEAAARFYERHGFIRSPLGERIMLMPIETVRSLIGKQQAEHIPGKFANRC